MQEVMVMAGDTIEEGLRKLELQRFAAFERGDISVLAGMLADDLSYTHSNGLHESKAELLNRLQSGELKYEQLEPEQISVRIYGEAAVLTGVAHGKAWASGTLNTFRLRYTDVYVLAKDAWKMVAWQSTRLP
jgi:hypothetical protein